MKTIPPFPYIAAVAVPLERTEQDIAANIYSARWQPLGRFPDEESAKPPLPPSLPTTHMMPISSAPSRQIHSIRTLRSVWTEMRNDRPQVAVTFDHIAWTKESGAAT